MKCLLTADTSSCLILYHITSPFTIPSHILPNITVINLPYLILPYLSELLPYLLPYPLPYLAFPYLLLPYYTLLYLTFYNYELQLRFRIIFTFLEDRLDLNFTDYISVEPGTGRLMVDKSFDRELVSQLNMTYVCPSRVNATSGQANYTCSAQLTILDVDDNGPWFKRQNTEPFKYQETRSDLYELKEVNNFRRCSTIQSSKRHSSAIESITKKCNALRSNAMQ